MFILHSLPCFESGKINVIMVSIKSLPSELMALGAQIMAQDICKFALTLVRTCHKLGLVELHLFFYRVMSDIHKILRLDV